jgi:hypothetical protein
MLCLRWCPQVPQSEEHVTGGNIVLCFRQLPATSKKPSSPVTTAKDPLRSSRSYTEQGGRYGGKTDTSSGKGNSTSRTVNSVKNIIYIDEDDDEENKPKSRSTATLS